MVNIVINCTKNILSIRYYASMYTHMFGVSGINMLKRNLVLATLLATLSITACSKKPKKPQLTVNLKPQQAQRVRY